MRTRNPSDTKSANYDAYQLVFMRRVHQLVAAAYERMKPLKKWACKKEEDISGELARHIDETLDQLSQPWMRYFALEPERHVDEPQVKFHKRRLGKHRRRMDFRFRCRQRKPILRFVYESKLLSDSGSFQDMLGESGLGRFLDRRYAGDDNAAGMLGYVMVQSPDDHASRTASTLLADAGKYRLAPGTTWTATPWKDLGGLMVFTLRHTRRAGKEITIYYAYLSFC